MNYFAHFIRIALKADVFNENISKFPNSLRFTLVSLLLSYKQFNYFFLVLNDYFYVILMKQI